MIYLKPEAQTEYYVTFYAVHLPPRFTGSAIDMPYKILGLQNGFASRQDLEAAFAPLGRTKYKDLGWEEIKFCDAKCPTGYVSVIFDRDTDARNKYFRVGYLSRGAYASSEDRRNFGAPVYIETLPTKYFKGTESIYVPCDNLVQIEGGVKDSDALLAKAARPPCGWYPMTTFKRVYYSITELARSAEITTSIDKYSHRPDTFSREISAILLRYTQMKVLPERVPKMREVLERLNAHTPYIKVDKAESDQRRMYNLLTLIYSEDVYALANDPSLVSLSPSEFFSVCTGGRTVGPADAHPTG